MTRWLLALALVGSLVAHAEPQHCLLTARTVAAAALQATPHVEPPKGWQCGNRKTTDKDHQCACHRTCEWNPETRQVEEREDPGCLSYCFRDHCTCLSECDSH